VANVYGQNGNRWWVAYNTSQQDRTILGTSVGNPLTTTPSGYESLPSGDAADDAQFAAAAAATAKLATPFAAGKGPTISVENITWANVNGPYTSQSLANAAIPAIQKAEPAPNSIAATSVGSAVSSAESDVSSIEGFLSGLTSANLWIRVAKVALGSIMIIVGLVKLTGIASDSGLVQKAVKVAPLL
jgi:hypothetical protein